MVVLAVRVLDNNFFLLRNILTGTLSVSVYCGFRRPTKITALNVLITGKVDSVFAIKLKTHFNVEAAQSLVVQIDNEVQKKQTATYSNGVSSSYTLTLSVRAETTGTQ
jgi:shikimate kinase